MEEGEDRGDLLAAFEPEKGAELLEELADDDAVDLMGELEPRSSRRFWRRYRTRRRTTSSACCSMTRRRRAA